MKELSIFVSLFEFKNGWEYLEQITVLCTGFD